MNFSEPRRIAHLRAQITSVAFSPDGTRLAFACERNRRCTVFLAESDGSNPVLLAGRENRIDDSYWNLRFSPDGTFLMGDVSEEDGEFSDICRINVATGAQTRLTDDRASGYPSLSPDGRYIVFQSHREGVNDIYRMTVDGDAVAQLTHTEPWFEEASHDPIRNAQPCYSPDGNWIAFLSSVYDGKRDNIRQLFLMRADGSDRTRLTYVTLEIRDFLWHPDSQRIVFTVESELSEGHGRILWKYRSNLFMIGVDQAGLRQLEFSDDVNHLGGFSPDGRYLAYSTSAGERFKQGWRNWDIRLLDLEAGTRSEPVVVTNDDIYDTSPLFNPNGATLLFASERGANPKVSSPDLGGADLYAVDIVR